MNDQDLPKSMDAIRARFPYQFAGESIGTSVPKGWAPLFERLCADIDAVLGEKTYGFHWVQLKEKFGSARFYYGFGRRKAPVHLDIVAPDGVLNFVTSPVIKKGEEEFGRVCEAVEKLVSEATTKTRHACLVCGELGEVDQSDRSYLMVLCPAHQATRHTKDGWPEDLWDMLEEDRIKIKEMRAELKAWEKRKIEAMRKKKD